MDETLKGFVKYNEFDEKDAGTIILGASSTGEFTPPFFPEYFEDIGIKEGDSPEAVTSKIRKNLERLEASKNELSSKNDPKANRVIREISDLQKVLKLLG
ncbi:hypothetical protein C0416_01080 [bacterium]|nr:hypothetical protein [bacterium]